MIALGLAAPVGAQAAGELWGDVTIEWLASERTTYVLDVEPKLQLTSIEQSRFSNIDVWPTAEYAVSEWFDVEGEFLAGVTNEQDGSNTTEVTQPLGGRFHLLSRLIQERDVIA
jgi:hypothetical protein